MKICCRNRVRAYGIRHYLFIISRLLPYTYPYKWNRSFTISRALKQHNDCVITVTQVLCDALLAQLTHSFASGVLNDIFIWVPSLETVVYFFINSRLGISTQIFIGYIILKIVTEHISLKYQFKISLGIWIQIFTNVISAALRVLFLRRKRGRTRKTHMAYLFNSSNRHQHLII